MNMLCWRITKFPPNADKNEWTSVSDIGTMCAGRILDAEEYLKVEKLYLETINLIAKCNKVSYFKISALEPASQPIKINVPINAEIHSFTIQDGSILGLKPALYVAQKVLREEMWCKLENAHMFVHFGYDYYMYIGSEHGAEFELQKIQDMGLFVKQMKSPYQ